MHHPSTQGDGINYYLFYQGLSLAQVSASYCIWTIRFWKRMPTPTPLRAMYVKQALRFKGLVTFLTMQIQMNQNTTSFSHVHISLKEHKTLNL